MNWMAFFLVLLGVTAVIACIIGFAVLVDFYSRRDFWLAIGLIVFGILCFATFAGLAN